jgi:hypothetical protein
MSNFKKPFFNGFPAITAIVSLSYKISLTPITKDVGTRHSHT